MLVGLVVTSLKKYSVEKLLSHDRDLKGFGFGFQRRLRPVITFEMFPFRRLAGCTGSEPARGCLRPSPSPVGAQRRRVRSSRPARPRRPPGLEPQLQSQPQPCPLRFQAWRERSLGGRQGQWRKMKARNLSCAWLAQQTAGR